MSFFILGAVFIWGVTLGADFLANLNVPPIVVAFFFIAIGGLALIWVLRNVGQNGDQCNLVALSAGLVASLIPMGFFGQLGTGIGLLPVVAVDLLGVLFFVRLWKKYNSSSLFVVRFHQNGMRLVKPPEKIHSLLAP